MTGRAALGVALAFAFACVAMCGSAERAGAQAPHAFVPVLSQGDAVVPIPLVDALGRPFSLAMLHGTTTIVSFVYTRCSDDRMCPLVAAKFARMQRELHGDPIRLVTVSLDPTFDTPAVLLRYGSLFAADPRRWTLATGTTGNVSELATRLGIVSQTTATGAIVHSEAAIVLGPDGRIARIVDGNAWTASTLLAEARAVAAARRDPRDAVLLWLSDAAGSCGRGIATLSVTTVLGLVALLSLSFGWVMLRALGSRPA